MTFIDVFLFLFLLFLLYVCFTNGVLKVFTILIGMYGGLQVAALFQDLFANLTARGDDINSVTTNRIVWFFILFLFWSIIFSLVAWSFISTIQLPKWALNADQLLGLALGIFASVFAMMVISFVFKNSLTMVWYGAGKPENWLLALKQGFDKSLLISIFDVLKVVYLNLLSPWLPARDLPVFSSNL